MSTPREVDVLVVGGGPAGLVTARTLRRLGVSRVEVLEREHEAGGIPRHSHHTGYGLRDLHRLMSGPAYARRQLALTEAAGVRVRTGVTATGWAGAGVLEATSPHGLEQVRATAVVLATGARERPRSARLVPGDRPGAGVVTTGQVQQAVHDFHQPIGRRAVVVGAEHVSYSAAVTLAQAGVAVVALVTDLPRVQTYPAFRWGAALRYRFPVHTSARIVRVLGRDRVTAVEIAGIDRSPTGVRTLIDCDTVVFTGDWAPDNELARRGDLLVDRAGLPRHDASYRSSVPGVFVAGNLAHPVQAADEVALEAAAVARAVHDFLAGQAFDGGPGVPVQVASPLIWAAPNCVRASAELPARLTAWSGRFVEHPVWSARQDGRVLFTDSAVRRVVPNRPIRLEASWFGAVDRQGGPVELSLASGRAGSPRGTGPTS